MSEERGKQDKPGWTGSYDHNNGRTAATVELLCESTQLAADSRFQDFANQLAQHVAALDPIALSTDDIPEAVSRIRSELSRTYADKPGEIREKLVAAKAQLYATNSCLLDQKWVFEDERSVREVLEHYGQRFGEQLSVGAFSRTERSA